MSTAPSTAMPEALSMKEVLRIPVMRRLGYAQIVSTFAERIGVRHVFAVCAGLLALLIVIGRLFMEPRGEPVPG